MPSAIFKNLKASYLAILACLEEIQKLLGQLHHSVKNLITREYNSRCARGCGGRVNEQVHRPTPAVLPLGRLMYTQLQNLEPPFQSPAQHRPNARAPAMLLGENRPNESVAASAE